MAAAWQARVAKATLEKEAGGRRGHVYWMRSPGKVYVGSSRGQIEGRGRERSSRRMRRHTDGTGAQATRGATQEERHFEDECVTTDLELAADEGVATLKCAAAHADHVCCGGPFPWPNRRKERHGDQQALWDALAHISKCDGGWPDDRKEQMDVLQSVMDEMEDDLLHLYLFDVCHACLGMGHKVRDC